MTASATRTRKQFRTIWMRDGMARPKSKKFASLAQAERMYRILTVEEPWREWAPEKEPGDYVCCSGGNSECGCGGLTCAEDRDRKREEDPEGNTGRLATFCFGKS